MRLGDEDEADEVLLLHLRALDAVAAAALLAVLGERHALHVAAVGKRYDARLVGDEVLDGDLVRVGDDLGAAARVLLRAVARLEVGEVGADYRVHLLGVGENRLELGDRREKLRKLVRQLVALEADELVEAHLEDCVDLRVGEAEALLQLPLRLVAGLRRADDPDDLVEVVDGEEQAVDDVPSCLRLPEVEARAARDDVEAVAYVDGEVLLEVQYLRAPSDDREQDGAERGLQLGVLVEVVEDDLADGVALQVDNYAYLVVGRLAAPRRALRVARVAARDVADVAYPLDDLLLHERGHVGYHLALVDAVGYLAYDDLLAPRLRVHDDLGLAAHRELAAPELVHRGDAVVAADRRAGREVGALHELHEVVDGAVVAVLHVVVDAVAELAEVVRRDVRRHADGDAARAVEEQVRQLRGEDRRLVERLVEVRHHVDRVLLEVAEELVGDALHAHLGVPHRGRRVAVYRAEVSVAVDEREPEREVLGETHDRVVHRRVAVRMVLADHLADDARRLHVLRVPGVAELVHREEAAAVDGLQPVAGVWQRAPDDDAHGVVDVVPRHLLFDVDVFKHAGGDLPVVYLLLFAHTRVLYQKSARAVSSGAACRKACGRRRSPRRATRACRAPRSGRVPSRV